MKKNIRMLISANLLMCAFLGASAESVRPLNLVPTLDPVRYLGRWYEIARYQHGFEKNLVGVTAEYTLRTDGRIDVVNGGFKNTLTGKYSSVKAVAWIPDTAKPGALKVRFFGLFAADYLVFGLDGENYEWAVVGDNSRSYLWLLSRTSEISDELYAKMTAIAAGEGYDVSLLFKVPQKAR